MSDLILLDKIKKAYFVGIGGVSMSSLAIILKNRGVKVCGYDLHHSTNTEMLEELGIVIDYEHDLSKLSGVDTVVYTAAVTEKTAPELSFAKENGITLLTRAALLGLVTGAYRYSVGVSGTHGKSTTTGMIASVFLAHDAQSSVISGCAIPQIGSSYKIGKGDRVVFEACEYKDSFLSMRPSLKVILNCKLDHVDYFKDIEQIKSSFRCYAETPNENPQADNMVVANLDCENTVDAMKDCKAKVYFYSTEKDADFCAKNIKIVDGCGIFDVYSFGKPCITGIKLQVPGLHNVSNATATAAAAILSGVSPDTVKEGLEAFCGVSRRFERKGSILGADVVDDYAHHPDEIEVTLNTAKTLNKRRIICVFQPHTYSRTKALLSDFARTLSIADKVILAPIYPAREQNTYGIYSEDLASLIEGAEVIDGFDKIAERLREVIEKDDLVITMGAGEAYKAGDILLSKG